MDTLSIHTIKIIIIFIFRNSFTFDTEKINMSVKESCNNYFSVIIIGLFVVCISCEQKVITVAKLHFLWAVFQSCVFCFKGHDIFHTRVR